VDTSSQHQVMNEAGQQMEREPMESEESCPPDFSKLHLFADIACALADGFSETQIRSALDMRLAYG
jgi:hypothetical protein